jgi:hypothetical protein
MNCLTRYRYPIIFKPLCRSLKVFSWVVRAI